MLLLLHKDVLRLALFIMGRILEHVEFLFEESNFGLFIFVMKVSVQLVVFLCDSR